VVAEIAARVVEIVAVAVQVVIVVVAVATVEERRKTNSPIVLV
jgi:hypothetical protein